MIVFIIIPHANWTDLRFAKAENLEKGIEKAGGFGDKIVGNISEDLYNDVIEKDLVVCVSMVKQSGD